MSNNTIVNSVHQYLASHCMRVDDEWLIGCVEFLTEDSSNNYSENDVKNLAKEQWLLNDLKDICPGSLPPNLKDKVKTVLTERFVLQINAAVDIGTPSYQQYLKLQKVNTENIEVTTNYDDKIPNHRMIKLYLTDGVQEISGIEYKPMRNLSCDITPGCKVLIKGPVECRRGVLLLTESTVELLGGEVQEIAVSHSLAGMLSSKLGLPMTQESDHNTTIFNPRNANIPTPHTQMPSARQTYPPPTDDPRPIARVTSLQVAHNNLTDADDDLDMDHIAAIEAEFTDNPGKRPLKQSTLKPEKKLKTEFSNNPDEYPDDIDCFIDEDEDYLKEIEAQFDAQTSVNVPVKTSPEPFVYIKQINDMEDSDKVGRVFKVKAQIMKLLSKLSVGKDGWSLKCTLIDGTGNIDVDFTNDVLSKLVGFTPQEMNELKRKMASNPALKEKAVFALQKAKDTLQVLYCLIELTILEVPKITSLVPFEDSHVDLLSKRVQTYKSVL